MNKLARSCVFFLGTVSLLALPAQAAEISVSLFGGAAWVPNSDVTIRQTTVGTDVTLHGVDWRSESFREPPYYGLRATLWLPHLREAGFGLDYTHAKAIAVDSQVVDVSGSRAGQVVAGWEPVGNTVQGLAFSHGLNLILLTMQRRWNVDGAWRPYVGLGAGAVLAHGEGRIGLTNGEAYHFGGLAFGGFGGVSAQLTGPFAVFAEGKLERAWVDVPYDQNTQVTTKFWVYQAAVGLNVTFGGGG